MTFKIQSGVSSKAPERVELPCGKPGVSEDDDSSAGMSAPMAPHATPNPTTPAPAEPKSPRKPDVETAAAPPRAAGTTPAMFEALRGKLAELTGLTQPRREALLRAVQGLQAGLTKPRPGARTPVYLMEGATHAPQGRPSTDPDENMALKVIALAACQRQEPSVIAVPDAANREHTLNFLQTLGAKASVLGENNALRPGHLHLVALDDESCIRHVKSLTPRGRELMVLGPPSGHAIDLLDADAHVTIMGGATHRGESLVIKSLTTNTRGKGCAAFVLAAVKAGATQFKSRDMGPSAISLAELALGTSLVTSADRAIWATNSERQMLGLSPWNLTNKRMMQGEALALFSTPDALEVDNEGEGFVYRPLLERALDAEPSTPALAEACARLGQGYEDLADSKAPAAARRARGAIEALITAHTTHHTYREKAHLHASELALCKTALAKLSDAQAVHTFVALALAFKSIYDEKTSGGWADPAGHGTQWHAAQFMRSYAARPGKQVPYDALVVLQPFIGMGTDDADKARIADMVEVALMAELAPISVDLGVG